MGPSGSRNHTNALPITEHIDQDTSIKVGFELDLPGQLLLKWVYPERGSDL